MAQVAIMPYFRATEGFRFGGFAFTVVDPSAARSRFSSPFDDWMEWYLSKYRDHGCRVEPVTLVHLESSLLLPDDSTNRLINRLHWLPAALGIPFLATMVRNGSGPVSESFTLVVQRFKPYSQTLAVTDGSMISVTAVEPEDSDLIFTRPTYVVAWTQPRQMMSSTERLLKGLDSLLKANVEDHGAQSVLRSAAMFKSACSNYRDIPHFERLVMLVAAYQTLVAPGEKNGQRLATKVIESLGCPDKPTRRWVRRFIEKHLWAMRSDYSHGKDMSSYEGRFMSVFTAARWLYGQLLVQILRDRGHISPVEPMGRQVELTFGRPAVPMLDEASPSS